MNKFLAYPYFRIDALNGFIALAIGLFSILTLLYSSKFMPARRNSIFYYSCIFLTAIAACLTVLCNHLLLLLALWGFLGLTLYLLINTGQSHTEEMAKKTFIIIGGTDALMLLGVCLIYYLKGSWQMDNIRLELTSGLSILAYGCIAIACFAKAGAMPFHSWLPDCAELSLTSVVAYLPASLDKLLGIYLLARLSLDLFIITPAVSALLMSIGAFTIIAAVFMALIQHNLKRLLGYHAVSQVGYMLLGIGTANPIGIAGGLFHMLNNAIYKSCLFFAAGDVERQAQTLELDRLGGLAKSMPFTYISTLIASLSISGIPPFNGFVSKWLIYQGLISQIGTVNFVLRTASILGLVAAMFGSGLTIASFMKVLHAAFLGQRVANGDGEKIQEAPWQMWLPCVILAAICIIFGIFAYALPLRYFIFPAVSMVQYIDASDLLGNWMPVLATILLACGMLLGYLFFKLGNLQSLFRQDGAFVGGEIKDPETENMVTGTDFYNTIRDFRVLKIIYAQAEKGAFDIYTQGKNMVFCIGRFLQYLHNGVLPTYLVWTLLGMIALFFIIVK